MEVEKALLRWRLMRTSRKGISQGGGGGVLFKFNGELNVLVPPIEIRMELNSGVLIVKQGESVINITKPDDWKCTIIHDPFFFEITHKNIGQNWS